MSYRNVRRSAFELSARESRARDARIARYIDRRVHGRDIAAANADARRREQQALDAARRWRELDDRLTELAEYPELDTDDREADARRENR